MSNNIELPSGAFVTAKEFAAAAGLHVQTVRERLHLWEQNPKHPLGIPFLRKLGRPYRIPRTFADAVFIGDDYVTQRFRKIS